MSPSCGFKDCKDPGCKKVPMVAPIVGPAIGSKIFLKPEKIAREGTLPPNLSEAEKKGPFKVLSSDNSQIETSYCIEMPAGKGRPHKDNGRDTYAWYIYLSDVLIEKSPSSDDKDKGGTVNPIRGGDVIKTNKPHQLSTGISKEDNEKGFRVLGVDDKGIYVDVPNGDLRYKYGFNTNLIPASEAIVIRKYKPNVGDYVRILKDERGAVSRSLNDTDHFQGFKILGVDGKTLILDIPRELGLKDNGYPGKSVSRVSEDAVELAPALKARRGDKVRVKKEFIPSRIPKQFYDQDIEVVEVIGDDFRYLEYNVRWPDGTTNTFSENRLDFPADAKRSKKKTSKVSSSKEQEESVSSNFKEGMKVKVRSSRRGNLPDSFSDEERRKSFKILGIDDDQVTLAMPKNCDEAEFDDDFNCRVWVVDLSDLEETSMAKSRGGVAERFAANAEKGAFKAVGRKLTKATKAGILRAADAAARANGMNEGQVAAGIQMFTTFMESEFGNAFISAMLGMALAHLAPQLPVPAFQDERLQDLADEMESEGSAVVMEKVVDIVMTYIAPGIGDILQGLPAKTAKKVRVATEGKVENKKSKKKVGGTRIGSHEAEEQEGEEETEKANEPGERRAA